MGKIDTIISGTQSVATRFYRYAHLSFPSHRILSLSIDPYSFSALKREKRGSIEREGRGFHGKESSPLDEIRELG